MMKHRKQNPRTAFIAAEIYHSLLHGFKVLLLKVRKTLEINVL